MSLSGDLNELAEDLLSEFGFDATLNRLSARANTGTEYRPVYGAAPTATVRIFDWDEEIRDKAGQVTGARRKVLISTSAGVVPDEADTLTTGGLEHQIRKLQPVTLQDAAIVYQAELVH